SFDNPLMPIQIFLIYVVVQWWVRYDSDGTGYIAQRINTAASPKDAQKGSLLFSVAFIALRTWPWILVALVSLVLFPLADADMLYGVEGAIVGADREMAYPLLMKLVLPVGLLGLTFTSLMAAFMSTVDTHFNWGASYLSNDIYRRFINPKATEKQLVGFSRWMVAFIAVLAVIFASQMDSIGGAWKFFINAASGMGIAQLMRWLWWRANAWTEISAMITALITTFIVTIIAENMIAKYPYLENHYDTYALVFIALLSIIVAIVFTFLTPKVGEKTIKNFIETCQPVGIWKGEGLRQNALKGFGKSLIMWVLGMTVSFAGLFSIGYFLMLKPIIGILALVLCVGSFIVLIKMMEKE
ncbi:MAG: sodium:solute symporter family transporter, partial [Chitinophagales bacterium]